MLRMFSFRLIALLLEAFFLGAPVYSTSSSADTIGTIAVGDPTAAARVFVGPEAKMPVDHDRYDVSINPTLLASGKFLIPATANEALLELSQSIPSWVLNALANSHGDFECSVVVSRDVHDDEDYYTLLEDWYRINWNLYDVSSPLRKDFARRGVADDVLILQSLRAGMCTYAKTRDLKQALDILNRYGHLK